MLHASGLFLGERTVSEMTSRVVAPPCSGSIAPPGTDIAQPNILLTFYAFLIMPPTLLLVRHAQALHNATSDWSIPDPRLTELGEQQCRELQESLKNTDIADQVELIVVSAMRRTLQTADIGLGWLIKEKGIKVLPDAGWQGEPVHMHLSCSAGDHDVWHCRQLQHPALS